MSLSLKSIIKQSAKFNLVQIAGKVLAIPEKIIIAMVLMPEDYGIIGFLGLWLTYGNLMHPGIVSAASREIPYYLGKKNEKEALRIQNIAISGDLIYSILPFLVILCSSFFFSKKVIMIGLIITAINYVPTHFVNIWSSINFVRQRFNIVSKGRLIFGVTNTLIVVSLIYWLKIYAVLIAPIIAGVITGVYYLKKGKLNYVFQFNWEEIKKLMKVGIVLALLGVVYWGFRLADRTIISIALPLSELGFYTFAMSFIMVGLAFFTDFTRVLAPIAWKDSAQKNNNLNAFNDLKRIAVYLTLGTAMIIPFSQLCFYLLVNLVTTKYIASIPIFYVLSYNFYLVSHSAIPNMILESKIVNKQSLNLAIYSIGVLLNVIMDIIVIKLGYGVAGVAWVTIITQGSITILLYLLSRKYMVSSINEFMRFLIAIVIPFLVSILFYIFHNYLSLIVFNPWLFAVVSLITQILIWIFVIKVFYKNYFPKKKVIDAIKAFYKLFIERLNNDLHI